MVHVVGYNPGLTTMASLASISLHAVNNEAPPVIKPGAVRVGLMCGPADYNTSDHFTVSAALPGLPGAIKTPLTVGERGALSAGLDLPLPGPVPWGVKASASYKSSVQVWAGAFLGIPDCNAYLQFHVYGR
jgi:hypothetical protein